MRKRLVASSLTVALVAVMALGLPLLVLSRHQVWSAARARLHAQASTIAAGMEDRLDMGEVVDLRPLAAANPGRRLVLRSADGTVTTAGPTFSGGVLTAGVPVSGGRLTVLASVGPASDEADEVTLVVLGLSAAAVLAAWGLSWQQGRRLAAPLNALAERADALGRGQFGAEPLVTGVPEVDSVAEVLDRSGQQIGGLLAVQREFAGDAAHQLRTPLTGIGLRLEEIARLGHADVREEAEDAMEQVERLDRVITSLLARSRGDEEAPADLDVSELVEAEALAWARVFEARGRALHVRSRPDLRVQVRRSHVSSVLACLWENALRHGAGHVHVGVFAEGQWIRIAVEDQGSGVPQDAAERVFTRRVSGTGGTGIGLALARSLARGEGGTLELDSSLPARFILSLPRAQPPEAAANRVFQNP